MLSNLLRQSKCNSYALFELWKHYERYIFKCVYKYKEQDSNIITMEDIMQSAFVGFCKGVIAFDNNLITNDITEKDVIYYLLLHIKREIRCYILRIGYKKDLITEAVSLDCPLPGTEECLLDTIEDTNTPPIDNTIIEWDIETIVNNALLMLPANQNQVIYLKYYKGLTQNEIADIMGISYNEVTQLKKKAFYTLRRNKHIKELGEELCFNYVKDYYTRPAEYYALNDLYTQNQINHI